MSLRLEHLQAFVVITGLTGAGKSSVLDILSDLGFFVVDNLPVELLHNFVNFTQSTPSKFALTSLLLDVDSAKDVQSILELIKTAQNGKCRRELVFVDCSADKIINRYNETRRPHPGFDAGRDKTIADAIQRERDLLQPLKEAANYLLDTSKLNVHDLKRELKSFVDSLNSPIENVVRVNFVSFGYKYGTPQDCDLLIDVRFIPNPYFIEGLRDKTGLEQDVASYILAQKESRAFLQKYGELLAFLLPHYMHEGKSYLNIGVGCTGGRHRSVVIAEELLKSISDAKFVTSIKHRDLNKYSNLTRE